MKIAFTAAGKDWDAMIDPRFGRTDAHGDLLCGDFRDAEESPRSAGVAGRGQTRKEP